MDIYEVEEKKQAAADVLVQYSPFVMTCIGEGIQPNNLRLHLLKEISGMPTTMKRDNFQQRFLSVNIRNEKIDKPSSTRVVENETTENEGLCERGNHEEKH